MIPKKLANKSVEGSQLNLEALYAIAPSCFTEVQDPHTGETKRVVNFATLRTLLGDDAVESDHEMYQFTWPGKQAARLEAASETTETLRPLPEESLDWDTTQNIYIEGDNLRVLKLLQRSYLGKVNMIYIDPPYNTGNDFVYHDRFARSAAEEDLAAGDIDLDGIRYRRNTDSNGRFHSDWCSMMLSRLLVAHSLLSEDGVIFISIDDNEVHNLRKICDEVFGERNFVAELIWKSKSGGANDSRFFAVDHEYILCYAKSSDSLVINLDKNASVTTVYNQKDEKGEYSLDRLDKQSLGYIESLDFPIIASNGEVYRVFHRDPEHKVARWRWSKETVKERFDELVFKDGNVYTKNYKKEGSIPRSLLTEERFGRTRTGKTDFTALFEAAYFSAPKPYKLISFLLDIICSSDSLILDFFSGSATTAHAVMQLNAEDLKAGKEGKRKYICVQLDEKTPEDSEARKAGYTSIPEIAKERIRRAGEKIREENPDVAEHLDTGFRAFRLDSSNFGEVNQAPGAYNQAQLDLFLDNIKADRTELDLLFGAMLSWGVPLSLSQSMLATEVDGCTIYNVTEGELVACFAEKVTEAAVRAMAAMQPERVLFRDSCFAEDKMKINLFEIFKQTLDWDEREALDNIRVI